MALFFSKNINNFSNAINISNQSVYLLHLCYFYDIHFQRFFCFSNKKNGPKNDHKNHHFFAKKAYIIKKSFGILSI